MVHVCTSLALQEPYSLTFLKLKIKIKLGQDEFLTNLSSTLNTYPKF